MKDWQVYLLKCADNSLYCGVTNDLESRIDVHNAGRGAKYTKGRRPVELVAASHEMTKSCAFKLERVVKKVPAKKKIFVLKNGNKVPVLKILN